jgi:GMP synthase (glutamine-hydrolysing)
MTEQILILDFGSQYTQLIARRVRELNVYCEIHPYNNFPDLTPNIKGVILSGSPCSVRDVDAPRVDLDQFRKIVPLLGVCYGAQLMAQELGGDVKPSQHREYGRARLEIDDTDSSLLAGLSESSQVWMSHGDTIVRTPESFHIIASTESVKVAAFKIEDELTYGIQFHPEVTHTTEGKKLMYNFVAKICGCKQDWTSESFVEQTVSHLRQKLGNDRVVMALSGGVDSTVAATLVHQAVGENLYCIFVDNGLLRKDEFEEVLHSYQDMGLNIKGVDSKSHFYQSLGGNQ